MESRSISNQESIDALVPGTEDFTVGETVADPVDQYDQLLDQMQQEELAETLWQLVDSLPEQQSEILHAQYEDNITLRQVSDKLGLEYQRTRQERDKALRELRKPHNSHKLEYFLPDRALSMAYGGGVESYNRTWTSSTERAAFEDLGWY